MVRFEPVAGSCLGPGQGNYSAPRYARAGFALATALAFFGPATVQAADDVLDDLEPYLTFQLPDHNVRARFSGTIELEQYDFREPAPAFIDASGNSLFNPRATLFVDAQIGPQVYAFVQTRVDRGFDPSDESLRARVDEYALRVTPWQSGVVSVQLGKFATVVGSWPQRHSSWDNPFINAPLPYEELTGLWDSEPAPNAAVLLFWAHVKSGSSTGPQFDDKYLRLPLVWGPSYATGFSVSGILGRFEYAAEVKNAGLGSRPSLWNDDGQIWDHPAVNGRVGFKPNPMWNFGCSVGDSPYLRTEAVRLIPSGLSRGDYRERMFAQDASFAWHHLQLWAEAFEARYSNPKVGDAAVLGYYVEAKYKLTPRWFVAARWNEQHYGRITELTGTQTKWGRDTTRADLATGFRFTAHTQLKIEYSLQHYASGPRENEHLAAAQFVLKF